MTNLDFAGDVAIITENKDSLQQVIAYLAKDKTRTNQKS